MSKKKREDAVTRCAEALGISPYDIIRQALGGVSFEEEMRYLIDYDNGGKLNWRINSFAVFLHAEFLRGDKNESGS